MSVGAALIGWRGYAASALAGAVIAGGLAWVVQGRRGEADLAAEVAASPGT